ncbi:glycoside hydrolase family 18 protein [Mycena floridula]|nr:glycoside hydrolase family 18 protein [Mycena floridula]
MPAPETIWLSPYGVQPDISSRDGGLASNFFSGACSSLMFQFLLLSAASFWIVSAFDGSRYDNVVAYWGQNSYGATHSDTANFQKTLAFYCQDAAVDVFPIAFVNVFFSTGGLPSMNLANTCNNVDNATFPGTALPNCAALAADIATCQAKGKLITISLGGATGGVGFSSDAQGTTFAQTIWDLFFGGSSATRPFGAAVLDGVDLDIEGGTSLGYAAFVTKLRSLASGANKPIYFSSAPQCIYPDAALGGVLNAVAFDAVYVQFYNNPCGITHYGDAANWDFGIWLARKILLSYSLTLIFRDNWARKISPNKNVKIYIGVPGAPLAAGSGYVDPSTLSNIAISMRKSFPSFGGVMIWDASQSWANNRYELGIKNALVAAGGTGFTFPPCGAAYNSANVYTAGLTASFNGYIFQAKWWTQSTPDAGNPNGDWSAISACSGSGSTSPTSTTTSTGPTSTSGSTSCSGIAAWSSTAVYATPGTQVVYNSHLYTNQWWTQGDLPTGTAGVWVDKGDCT